MNTLILYAVAALVLFGAGVAAGHKVTSNAWKADLLDVQNAHAKELSDANDRNNEIARELEDAREHVRVVYRDIEKQVDRVAERVVYRSDCIDDDGVQLLNDALRGPALDPGELNDKVPTPGRGHDREDRSRAGAEDNRDKPAVLRMRRTP